MTISNTPGRTRTPRVEGQAAPLAIFRELFGFDPFPEAWSMGAEYGVSRTENGYEVEIPVPGFAPSAIEITLKENVLTVSGKSEKRNFSRSLMIPEDVDPEGINAHVENGLLTLALSRRPEAQPRKIQISVGDAVSHN
ncbi:MAG TPA: Hsp20 family protein [Candidatus Baltobacteraceae bacterium]|nr:Hsp20 family protein [Candidatus Baltobacteraceae bacterium]